MKITDEIIDYIEMLSKLELDEEEKRTAKVNIEKIINYMDILNTVDTTNIAPMSYTFASKNVFREDIVMPSVDRDVIVSNSPNNKGGCFKVPKTVE